MSKWIYDRYEKTKIGSGKNRERRTDDVDANT